MVEVKNYNQIIKEIAHRLKELRMEKGFSSYESFAYHHDLSRVQYWRMEKGTNFTIKYLLKILEVHQITLEEFFCNTTTKEK